MRHKLHKCATPCSGRCPYCDGGLQSYTVCGAAEGELLRHCPGHKLTQEDLEAIYSGRSFLSSGELR